jgi:hypothetical protein
MGLFTARNRQNPFAERKRREAEQRAAEVETAALEANADAREAIADAKAQLATVAVPVDLNPDSAEYTQAPDISTYASGGIVEPPKPVLVEPSADEEHEAADPVAIEIPAKTQAKIDAVMNRAIPPIADEQTAETPAAEPESDAKRGRGRPRPQETIDRDNAVHELLKAADAVEGVSKEALALSLDEKEQQVYSSLRQLSKEGRAENRYVKGHGYRWFAA